jgi:hypothetical protein
MSFSVYDIEEEDILTEYALAESGISGGNNGFSVINLETYEAVIELLLLNNSSDSEILVGYTCDTNTEIPDSDSPLWFLKTNDITQYIEYTDISNPNILRLPSKSKINRIVFRNVKNGPISPTGSNVLITCLEGDDIERRIDIVGNSYTDPTKGINLQNFNNNVIGASISQEVDETYNFVVSPVSYPKDSGYQIQMTIYYTKLE